ncbi:hypothetical protein V2W45_1348088 [Cenococcum geophilum]
MPSTFCSALHPNHQPTATPQTPHSPASPLRHSTTPLGTLFRLHNRNPDPNSTSNLSNSDLSKTGPSNCNNPSESREVDPSNTSKPQLTSESTSNPQPLSDPTDDPLHSESHQQAALTTQPYTMSSNSSPCNTSGTAGPAGSASASAGGQPYYHLPYAPFPFRMPDNANVRGVGSQQGQGSGGGKGK